MQITDGYIITLNIKDGLSRLSISQYTDHEWVNLPHVTINGTSELERDPSILDHDFKEGPGLESSFDETGDFKDPVIVKQLAYVIDPYVLTHRYLKIIMTLTTLNFKMQRKKNLDYHQQIPSKPPPTPEPPSPLKSSIYDSIVKDRAKLAGTHDTASKSYTGTKLDPHPPFFNFLKTLKHAPLPWMISR
jgi:hypothetical protein